MHSWLSNWGLVGSARDQILNYIQDLAKKYMFQTFLPSCFNHHHTYGALYGLQHLLIGDTLTTSVSQAFRWKFAGAKHLRRMEAAPQGRIPFFKTCREKFEVFYLAKPSENTAVCQICRISRKFEVLQVCFQKHIVIYHCFASDF